MKDKKKIVKILVLIGITCILWGLITMFISSVKKDQKEMNSRMDTITKSYTEFEKNIADFNSLRDFFHTEVLDKVYYETIAATDAEVKVKIKSYEESVSTISLSTKDNLRKYCIDDIYYSSSDVNNKCAAFKQGYEEMVNSFVDDVNQYNSNIDKYNEWIKGQGNTTGVLEQYKTKKKYIDYNNDGEYSGRNEEDNSKSKKDDVNE